MKSQSNFPELLILAVGLLFAGVLVLYGFFYTPPSQTVYVIYKNDTVANAPSTANPETATEKTLSTDTQPTNSISTSAITTEQTSIVNINTADKETLTTLKGIGDVKAQSIIDYRNSNGNFKTIDEIMLVSGIGEKTFENIKNNITV